MGLARGGGVVSLALTGLLAGATAAWAGATFAVQPFVGEFRSTSAREFEVATEWWVGFTPKADHRVAIHFTDAAGKTLFRDEFLPEPAMSRWPQSSTGKRLRLPARRVKVPEGVALPVEVRVGTLDPANDGFDAILGPCDRSFRVLAGKIKAEGGKFVYEAPR